MSADNAALIWDILDAHEHLASGLCSDRTGDRWPCDAALAATALAAADAEITRLHSWAGLMELLDEHWPTDLFPVLEDDVKRDAGARIVSLLRWVDRLRAEVATTGAVIGYTLAHRDSADRDVLLFGSVEREPIESPSDYWRTVVVSELPQAATDA